MKSIAKHYFVQILTIAFFAINLSAVSLENKPARTLKFKINKKDGGLDCYVKSGLAMPVLSVCFNVKGDKLVSGSYGEVIIWNLSTGSMQTRIGTGIIKGNVRSVKYIDEQRIAVAAGEPGQNGAVYIFSITKNRCLHTFSQFTDVVNCLVVNHAKTLMAAGDSRGNVFVWNIADGKLVKKISELNGEVSAIIFNNDDSLLAAGDAFGSLKIWQTEDWAIRMLGSYAGKICSLYFNVKRPVLTAALKSKDGSFVVSLRIPQQLLDPKKLASLLNRQLRVNSKKQYRPVFANILGMQTYGWKIYAHCTDNTVKQLAYNGKPTIQFKGANNWIYSMDIAKNGLIAGGDGDGVVYLWEPYNSNPLLKLLQINANSNDWLVLSINGLLHTTVPQAISWKSDANDLPTKPMLARFNQPEKLQKWLRAIHLRIVKAQQRGKRKGNKNRKNKNRKNKNKKK